MEAIKVPELMQRVDFAAEVFAPITLRALLCRPQVPCDRPRRVGKKEALKLCSQVAHHQGSMLATLACLGYSPKAHTRTCPDVWVLVEEMEAMVGEMLKLAPEKIGTSRRQVSLTDAELRGVHASVHSCAATTTTTTTTIATYDFLHTIYYSLLKPLRRRPLLLPTYQYNY